MTGETLGMPAPVAGIFDEPVVRLDINVWWSSWLHGKFSELLSYNFAGDSDSARQEIEKFLLFTEAQNMTTTSYVCCQERQSPSSNGGTFASGDWRVRPVSLTYDSGGIVIESEIGRVKLPAGLYRAVWSAVAVQVDRHITRIVAGDVVVGTGTAEYAAGTVSGATSTSVGACLFELDGEEWVSLQHRCSRTQVGNGFGNAANLGVNNTYAILELLRLA